MQKKSLVYKVLSAVMSVVFAIFTPIKVSKNAASPDGKMIICCNHISLRDPFFIGVVEKRQVNFMAKAELFKNKIIAWGIRQMGGFPVQRGSSDRSAIETSKDILNRGDILGIFIEGTRSKTGELLKPKSGAALIAHACDCPVLPMCITAQGGGKVKLFKKVKLSYGDIIYPQELGITTGTSSELRNASRLIMDRIAALRERDLRDFT